MGTLLLFLFIAVFSVVVGWLKWRHDEKRRAQVHAFATAQGWGYADRDDSWTSRWTGPPFGEGDHRHARNIVTGVDARGRRLVAFDYSYETHTADASGGRSTQTFHWTVCALHLPAPLPRLVVSGENVLTRLGDRMGLVSDIELESEQFNRHFRVHAEDRRFASDVLTPRTMELLLARERVDWRIDGGDIIAWHSGELSPARLLETAMLLGLVVDNIPSFVWHDRAAPAEGAARLSGGRPPPA